MRYKELLRAPEEEPGQGAGGAGIGGEAAEAEQALIPETETSDSGGERSEARGQRPEADEIESFETEEDLARYLEAADAAKAEGGRQKDEGEEDAPDTEPEAEAEAADDEPEDEPKDEETDDSEAEAEDQASDDAEDKDLETAELWKKLPKEHRNTVRELIRQSVTERLAKESEKSGELKAKSEEFRAKSEELQARSEEQEATIAQLKAQKVVPVATPDDPLADVANLTELDIYQGQAERIDDWMDEHFAQLQPEREDPMTGETLPAVTLPHPLDARKQIDYETARKLKLQVKQDLRAYPRKREWFRQQAAIERELHEKVPSLKDPKSALSKQVAETIAAMPWMKQSPGYRVAALHYNVGRLLNKAADEAGVGVEAMLADLIGKVGDKSEARGERPTGDTRKPLPSGEQLKAPAKPVARPVPAVRKTPATTGKAVPKAGFIDSHEDLVETLMARM